MLTAVVMALIAEMVATRFGRRPVDALRLLTVFLLAAGAAWAHATTMSQLLDRTAVELRGFFEANLARSKDTFISNVSHGLRTPLTGVVGFAHLLGDSPVGTQQREAANMIVSESAELSRMVDDLVVAAQLDAGAITVDLKPTSMLSQVDKVCEFMSLMGAEIGIDLQEVDLLVDPERFTHILRNLVANAHRHGKPTITVRGAVAHGRYVIHVVDQGPGVSAKDQKDMFGRFSSSTFGSQFTGSIGLGLAVVAELSARIGCQVSYRRIRGETQFVLSVPLADAGSATAPQRIVRTPSSIRQPHAGEAVDHSVRSVS
ncbi:MAG: HAMP domain-containing sensor histidine kinase [Acidimicrobiia bacterium]